MRMLIASIAIVAFSGAIGCGKEKSVSDDAIIEALKLKPDPDQPVYAIGGDTFCEVDQELLNNASEIDEAESEKGSEGLVITDRDQTVGVRAVPPFDPSCERDARRALDQIGGDDE
jgi:hypothetical protein